ncbi:carbon-nitrogen hydrolase [Virgibacillus profundi]|uniref:Carbon-nitrogen hydrolase n=1 Tax=Virgibacillus profundi TaxID=2024555 RepID=A0A2A2I9F2_9BACI|nr:carbon-nitrogen family hydrolase [Virgibacillus profundi]PAV28267.1 carbon-nitrogen hydrolase [Virgibacillus profundi]PXY52571.1 carbon-nitrogen family hydrolase [Virgibacillus profundi]
MKIAAVQIDVCYGEPDKNFPRVEEKITEAAAQGANIVVLPEMWNTGYDLARLEEIADVEGKRTKELFTRLSKELGIHIIGGSVSTRKGNEFFNTMYVVNKHGEIISSYDKAHLFKLMDEHHYLQQGNQLHVFSLDNVQMGGVICYDIRFPEWLRKHVLEGANLLFVPAQWPAARIDHWRILLQARAIENQCFVIGVNRVGEDPNNTFNGQSMVIAPWGEVIWIGENKETIGIIDLQLQEVEEVRKRIPVFQDRREDLYK